jgi:pullulanase/glycogen debranching enzyme
MLRARQKRNLLATLMHSRGFRCWQEMNSAERKGNNNAYCQDEISWVDWPMPTNLIAFVKKLAALRGDIPVFWRQQFAAAEIGWYRNDGKRMTSTDCCTPWAKAIGMFQVKHR